MPLLLFFSLCVCFCVFPLVHVAAIQTFPYHHFLSNNSDDLFFCFFHILVTTTLRYVFQAFFVAPFFLLLSIFSLYHVKEEKYSHFPNHRPFTTGSHIETDIWTRWINTTFVFTRYVSFFLFILHRRVLFFHFHTSSPILLQRRWNSKNTRANFFCPRICYFCCFSQSTLYIFFVCLFVCFLFSL